MEHFVEINGERVQVISTNRNIIADPGHAPNPGQISLANLIASKVFQDQIALIGPECVVKEIDVQGVTMFGPRPGFVYLQAKVTDRDGKPIPGAVFCRGDSVAMLIELVCGDEHFALLVSQPRFPAGRTLVETAAGMLDGGGDFKGVAFKEIAEEVPALKGLFTLDRVTQLNAEPIWISPGGCNERMGFFHLRLEITREVLEQIHGSIGGLGSEGEQTTAVIVPWAELPNVTDAKLLIALGYYNLQVEIPRLHAHIAEIEHELDSIRRLITKLDAATDEEQLNLIERLAEIDDDE